MNLISNFRGLLLTGVTPFWVYGALVCAGFLGMGKSRGNAASYVSISFSMTVRKAADDHLMGLACVLVGSHSTCGETLLI